MRVRFRLIILTPGLLTLGATEEPDLALISRPKLTKPPLCFIISTFRASNRGSRESSDLISVIDNYNFFFLTLIHLLHQTTGRFFFRPATTGTDKSTSLILEHSPALLTEH